MEDMYVGVGAAASGKYPNTYQPTFVLTVTIILPHCAFEAIPSASFRAFS